MRLARWKYLPLVLLSSCAAPAPVTPPGSPAEQMRRDVEYLASDAMKGRDNATPEGTAAAEYVARRMAEAGLEPGGERGTWFQVIPGRKGDRGRNVIGARPGKTDEWIVIGAHHDGLGVRKGEIHNGADDNASGVAVILHIASRLHSMPRSQKGILFCSFDAEEDGLVGSTHFVDSGLYPVSSIAAMICFDLIGGSFLPGDEHRFFALGSESSRELFEWIEFVRKSLQGWQMERVGIYAIEPAGPIFARSDYSPFRLKKVPFVFFSTGTPWYYHTPQDDVERLDFVKMTLVGEIVRQLAIELAGGARPRWQTPAPDRLEDVRLLAGACRRVLENPAIHVSDRQRAAVAGSLEKLTKATEEGVDSKEIAPVVQQAMMVLFEVAKAQKPIH